MSTGQWIGTILGAIVGFILGNIYGAIYGAIIGYTLGGIVDPVKPDVKQPGAPNPLGLQIMTNVIGNPIFDVLGTAKITGQLLFFGKEFHEGKYQRANHVTSLIGYKYYASWALGICMGPADVLYTVFRDQDPIWEGELTRPESGGEATIQIEGGGTMVFYFGTNDQVPNIKAGALLPDPTLNTGYRHLCWAFFDAFFMNEYNRMPSMSFIIKKIPPMFSESTSQVQTYDINPAHALWHTLVNKAGLPEEWVHSGDFLAVATELLAEGRGISILFDAHQATQNYLEAINSHVDCILRYGSDGKFHPKLIRYVSPIGLPIIDKSKLVEEPTFSRRSWIDTINEVKVQYSEILGERPFPWVEYEYPFIIYDMRISGNDIFICGEHDDKAIVARIDLVSGLLMDYVEYHPSNGSDYFQGIEVDATDIYVGGKVRQTLGSTYKGVIQKRSRSNLSTISWTWAWAEGEGENDRECRDVCLDSDYVYGAISHFVGEMVGRCKVAKSNGVGQWELYGAMTSPSGILNPGTTNYVYISKHYGGIRAIDKITKSNGATQQFTYPVPYGGFYKGFTDGNSMWLGGARSAPSPIKMMNKISVSDLSQDWCYEEATPGGFVECFRTLADDDGVYGVGRDGRYNDTPFYQKIAANGSVSIWLVQDSLNASRRILFAFCQTTDLLYIGTYDQGTNLSTIRRYGKTDGVLVIG